MESFQYRVHDALEEQCPNLLPLVYMLDIKDKCETCDIFNKSEDIQKQSNHCNEYGDCIATTLHSTLQEKIWEMLQ